MRRYSAYKNAAITIMAALITVGCGGGGSGSTKVEIISDADAVAYQIGEGTWKDDLTAENLTDGRKRYTFDQTGKYGVALYCKGTSDKGATVFQLTTAESRSVIQNCSKGVPATLSGTVKDQTGVPNIKYYALSMYSGSHGYSIVPHNNTAYTIKADKGTRDLVTVSLAKDSNNKYVPQKFHIERGINFLGSIAGHVVTMTSANTHTMQGFDFTSATNTKGYSFLYTAHKALFRADTDAKWYLPDSGLAAEDTYLFYGTYKTRSYLEVYGAESIPQLDKVMDASYVAALQGTGYTKMTRTFDGLAYTPSVKSQPMKYFVLNAKKNTPQAWVYVVLSSGWLASKTTYVLPDLSFLTGFAGVWKGQNADKAGVCAYMSNKTIGEMFEAEKVYAPENSSNYFFVIPGIKYETAHKTIF